MGASCFNRIWHKIMAKEIKEDEYGRAKQFRLFSIARPHMRAFHSSWFCFFLAFTSWFGLQPLLPTIMKEFQLSKNDVANSGIASVAATIILRVFVGPLCDRFGPRRVMSALLLSGSIPMVLACLVRNGTGLIVLRLFIGVLGGAFVPCQFWTSMMFNSNIVGTANALVGGWGNLGGGFTFLFMPALFHLITMSGVDEFLAWKIAVVVPASLCCITGISILFTTDDCPQGEWRKRTQADDKFIKQTAMLVAEEGDNFRNDNEENNEKSNRVWTVISLIALVIHYGMCFGVEIAINTVINLYLLYKFKVDGCNETSIDIVSENGTGIISGIKDDFSGSVLNQNTASLIASLFGLMNLFARAMGGSFSDILFKHYRISGRLLAHNICLVGEGIMLIVFSRMTSIPLAIMALIMTSLFVQASEGTTFSIVPSINRKRVGLIAGFVGAGGNAGAIAWNTMWIHFVHSDPSQWFFVLGIIVLCGSLLTLFIQIDGASIWHVFTKKECNKDKDCTELCNS